MKTDQHKYPDNFYIYFSNNPNFEERVNIVNRIIYSLLILVCIVLIIYPKVLPISGVYSFLIVRIVASVCMLIFGFLAYFGSSVFYSIKSGGQIKEIAIKKFNCSLIREEELLELFDNNDFKGLADAEGLDDQPLQLYINEDEMGKVFYLQLMKYFSTSDFRGITEVKVISEPEYSKYYNDIRSIKTI